MHPLRPAPRGEEETSSRWHPAPACLRQGCWSSLFVIVMLVRRLRPASSPAFRGSSGGDSLLCVRYCRKLERPHWWCHVRQVVSTAKDQGQFGSCCTFSASQVASFWVFSRWSVPSSIRVCAVRARRSPFPKRLDCSWCCLRVDSRVALTAQSVDVVPISAVKQCVPRISWCRHSGYHCGGQCCPVAGHRGPCWTFSATQAVLSQLVFTSGEYRVELPQVSTGTYSYNGWEDGGNVGAYVFLSTVAGFPRVSGCQWISYPLHPLHRRSSPFLVASIKVSPWCSALLRVRARRSHASHALLKRLGMGHQTPLPM